MTYRTLHLEHTPARWRTRFPRPVLRAVQAIAVLAVVGIVAGVSVVSLRLGRDEGKRTVCAERLALWKERNPVLAKGLMKRWDACSELRDAAPELAP